MNSQKMIERGVNPEILKWIVENPDNQVEYIFEYLKGKGFQVEDISKAIRYYITETETEL